jgi:hypothetical protein
MTTSQSLQLRTKDGVKFGKELREKEFSFGEGFRNLNHGEYDILVSSAVGYTGGIVRPPLLPERHVMHFIFHQCHLGTYGFRSLAMSSSNKSPDTIPVFQNIDLLPLIIVICIVIMVFNNRQDHSVRTPSPSVMRCAAFKTLPRRVPTRSFATNTLRFSTSPAKQWQR